MKTSKDFFKESNPDDIKEYLCREMMLSGNKVFKNKAFRDFDGSWSYPEFNYEDLVADFYNLQAAAMMMLSLIICNKCNSISIGIIGNIGRSYVSFKFNAENLETETSHSITSIDMNCVLKYKENINNILGCIIRIFMSVALSHLARECVNILKNASQDDKKVPIVFLSFNDFSNMICNISEWNLFYKSILSLVKEKIYIDEKQMAVNDLFCGLVDFTEFMENNAKRCSDAIK